MRVAIFFLILIAALGIVVHAGPGGGARGGGPVNYQYPMGDSPNFVIIVHEYGEMPDGNLRVQVEEPISKYRFERVIRPEEKRYNPEIKAYIVLVEERDI